MKMNLRRAGFYMLGVISLFYVVFSRNFAEMRLQVSFFNFPIFIGEILLFLCLVLSFLVFDFRSIKSWQWGVVFYFACVILKALWGYILWGPLAFRHAALLYYPVFIFFGFIFYKRDFLPEFLKIFIVFLTLILCVTRYFYGYWVFALWVITFILIKSFSYRPAKYFFYAGLLCAVFITYKDLILTSRTFTVGNMAAVVFLIVTFLFIVKVKVFYKAIIVGMILITLTVFMFKLSTFNAALETIFDIKGTIELYKVTDAEIKDLKNYFVPQTLKDIKLFNPEEASKQQVLPDPTYILARDRRLQAKRNAESYKTTNNAEITNLKSYFAAQMLRYVNLSKFEQSLKAGKNNWYNQISYIVIAKNGVFKKDKYKVEEDLFNRFVADKEYSLIITDDMVNTRITKAIAYGNSMFRIFIWRDMVSELYRYRPIIGFSFGKPFRSESMEILNQASGEWERDGWIEPHNSYLNIIYRMGILGVVLIGFLIWQFCFMVKSFIKLKSISGILLCSVLINWSIAANFLPILELPYNAIPFWALWGVALGYLNELKTKGGYP